MSTPTVTEERPLGGVVTGVRASVVVVNVSVGAEGAVSVHGEPHVVEQIETRLEGECLVVGPRGDASFSTSVPIEVRVPVSRLEYASGAAGARVTVNGLVGERFEVDAASGARMELRGQVASVSARAESGGMVDLSGLRAMSVSSESNSGGMIRS